MAAPLSDAGITIAAPDSPDAVHGLRLSDAAEGWLSRRPTAESGTELHDELSAAVSKLQNRQETSRLPVRLVKAAGAGDSATVDEWIAAGGPIDAVYDRPDGSVCGLTLLMAASIHGQGGMVSSLIKRGAMLDLQSSAQANAPAKGLSALMGACVQGHEAVVQTLLGASADVWLRTAQGATAAQLAAHKAHHSCAHLISQHAAELHRLHRRELRARNKLNWMLD